MSYFDTAYWTRHVHMGVINRPATILFGVQTPEDFGYDWKEEVKAVHMRNLGRALLIIAIEALEDVDVQN